MAAIRSICWFHGGTLADNLAAHRANELDRHVVRLRAGDWIWGRLLAGRHARHQAVADVHRFLLRPRGGRAERLPRDAARQQEVIARIARTTAVACVVIAIGFAIWKRNLAGPLG